MCRDISKGVEAAAEDGQQGKASTRVVAINEVRTVITMKQLADLDQASEGVQHWSQQLYTVLLRTV
jgi:hypothetical protein